MAGSLREKFETLSLISTSSAGLLISIADLLGVIDNTNFLKDRISSIILVILSLIALNIPFKNSPKESRTSDEFKTVMDSIHELKEDLLSQPARGIDIFSTTDEIIERLIEATVGAESVSTLNLSPSRGSSAALDRYFHDVHNYIHQTDSKLRSFRSIATLENVDKTKWILRRAVELIDSGRVSQSVFPHQSSTKVPIGFHIVFKPYQTPYVFFYPPVNPSGMMNGFLIKNEEIAKIMLSYFNFMWNSSPCIHTGRVANQGGLSEVLVVDPSLGSNSDYATLHSKIR